MSESRGAASVTLDTIIAAALLGVFTSDDIVDEECIEEQTRAVTDALLAKGLVYYCPECDEHFKPSDPPHAECEGVEQYIWHNLGTLEAS